jgi:glycosyltransferase involved in cell wall biosynthesis
VVGSGPEQDRLRRLARRLDVEGRVQFLGQRERAELLAIMRDRADVFLFPSMHDEAPWVVVEAASRGLPVVCLDVGGPPTLGGRAVAVSTPRRTVAALARMVPLAAGRPAPSAERFSMASRTAELRATLTRAGLLTEAAHSSADDGEAR